MKNTLKNRVQWIDILRGMAIVLMVPANLSPLWAHPHPLWFSLLASYAAPIFIMLSTGMVILNANKHDFKYFLHRGLLIMGFAVFMDVGIWRIFPFVTYDVLYLIGFSLPIIYLARRLSTAKLILLAAFIFALTPVLQNIFGYHVQISEVTWANRYWPGTLRLLQAWLIDGWFPVFPWLGAAFFGAVFFRVLFANDNYLITKKLLLLSAVLLLVGFVLLFFPTHAFNNLTNHGIVSDREGWSEIFYPPTLGYLITALGMIIVFARIAQYLTKFRFSKVLAVFGRFSLFIYLLHQAISVFIISPILQAYGLEEMTSGWVFASSVVLALVGMYFLCLLIEQLKRTYSPSSLVLQMVIGK